MCTINEKLCDCYRFVLVISTETPVPFTTLCCEHSQYRECSNCYYALVIISAGLIYREYF